MTNGMGHRRRMKRRRNVGMWMSLRKKGVTDELQRATPVGVEMHL
jgi:hypothetical protein